MISEFDTLLAKPEKLKGSPPTRYYGLEGQFINGAWRRTPRSEARGRDETFRGYRSPFIRSAEPGERWTWCYVDEAVVGELVAD